MFLIILINLKYKVIKLNLEQMYLGNLFLNLEQLSLFNVQITLG